MTNKKIELVLDILTQSIQISNNSIIDIFVEFASHTNEVNIRIYLKGWGLQPSPDVRRTIYLNWEESQEELQEVIEYLKEIKEEK